MENVNSTSKTESRQSSTSPDKSPWDSLKNVAFNTVSRLSKNRDSKGRLRNSLSLDSEEIQNYREEIYAELGRLKKSDLARWDVAKEDVREKSHFFTREFNSERSDRRDEAVDKLAEALRENPENRLGAVCEVFSGLICESIGLPEEFHPELIVHSPDNSVKYSSVDGEKVSRNLYGSHFLHRDVEDSPLGGVIEIFPGNITRKGGSTVDVVRVLAHETFHAYQDLMTNNDDYPPHATWLDAKRSYAYKIGDKKYIDCSVSQFRYENQALERSAEGFADAITPDIEDLLASAKARAKAQSRARRNSSELPSNFSVLPKSEPYTPTFLKRR